MSRAYQITLTTKQRARLEGILRRGTHPAHQVRHARILWDADTRPRRPRRTDAQVAARCGCSARTVARVRRTFAEVGFGVALEGWRRDGGRPKLTPVQDARLVALAQSEAPAGSARWRLRQLARAVDRVELPPLSPETVRRTLKNTASPGTGCSGG